MPIKYIVCDLGGVYFTDGTTIALQKIKSLVKNENKVVDELFRQSPKKEGHLLRAGKLNSEEFWKIVAKKLNIDQNKINEIKEIWYDSYQPNEGMKELLHELRKKFKIIVFSGNIKERIDYLEKKYSFLSEFDDFVFSFDHGMNKDDIDFYKRLLSTISAKPEECLFIDDKIEFLEMGRSLGMKTILFKDAPALKKELENYGISL